MILGFHKREKTANTNRRNSRQGMKNPNLQTAPFSKPENHLTAAYLDYQKEAAKWSRGTPGR